MENAKSRPKTLLDNVIVLLLNNVWQGWQSKYRTLLEDNYNETTMAAIQEMLDEANNA